MSKQSKQIQSSEKLNKQTEEQGHGKKEIFSPLHEIGGPKGPEPTRYGDWERKGRCIDF